MLHGPGGGGGQKAPAVRPKGEVAAALRLGAQGLARLTKARPAAGERERVFAFCFLLLFFNYGGKDWTSILRSPPRKGQTRIRKGPPLRELVGDNKPRYLYTTPERRWSLRNPPETCCKPSPSISGPVKTIAFRRESKEEPWSPLVPPNRMQLTS